MTEKEKMLAGQFYDYTDPELMKIWINGKNLMQKFNSLNYSNKPGQLKVLNKLLGSKGDNTQIWAPFYVDYGKFIFLGNNCEINMNCVFLDCNYITIGNNALIAPGVHIYTVFHPVSYKDRYVKGDNDNSLFTVSKTAPVTIGNNVWIGGNSILLPGISIGDNVTIGAGSVVTKSIRSDVLAYGNPCRIIKEI